MQILIVGLGAIGHSMVSSITKEGVIVDTVTTNGEKVEEIKNNLGDCYKVRNNYSYDTLEKKDYDFVIVTLPYKQKISRMHQIQDKISDTSTIVITPANQCVFYYMPKKLQQQNKFILLERVPQISRVSVKNSEVKVLGTRKDLRYSILDDVNIDEFIEVYSYLDNMVFLPHIDDISLISSNVTIHTVRIYNLYKDGNNYDKEVNFYKDWTKEDAKLFIDVEDEVLKISKIKANLENRNSNVYDMYTHFKITPKTIENVVEKISTNQALSSIKFYVKDTEDLVNNRYFADDILIGIYSFIELAKKYNIEVPTLQMIYDWGLTLTEPLEERKYLNIN